jgi:hypothetical protein
MNSAPEINWDSVTVDDFGGGMTVGFVEDSEPVDPRWREAFDDLASNANPTWGRIGFKSRNAIGVDHVQPDSLELLKRTLNELVEAATVRAAELKQRRDEARAVDEKQRERAAEQAREMERKLREL